MAGEGTTEEGEPYRGEWPQGQGQPHCGLPDEKRSEEATVEPCRKKPDTQRRFQAEGIHAEALRQPRAQAAQRAERPEVGQKEAVLPSFTSRVTFPTFSQKLSAPGGQTWFHVQLPPLAPHSFATTPPPPCELLSPTHAGETEDSRQEHTQNQR